MPLLSISNISYSINKKTILNAVSFAVEKGESWAIIGKNGAGKSTLIKCLCRLLRVSHGSISFENRDLISFTPRELARGISYVPQASGRPMPSFTVFDYVMMGRFPYQGFMALPAVEDKNIVNESLALTDTFHLSERRMNTLSGGELQRVFLAGAVAQRTELLLLDEPVTFLDPLHQELVRKALLAIHNEFGTTIITVTHDVNAALSRYSHVAALIEGSLYYAGSCDGFLKKVPEALFEVFSLPFNEAVTGDGRKIIVPGMLTSQE